MSIHAYLWERVSQAFNNTYIYIYIYRYVVRVGEFKISYSKVKTFNTYTRTSIGTCNVKDIVRSYNLQRYIIYYVRRACNILYG